MGAKFGVADGWDILAPRGPYGHSLWKGILQFWPLFKEGLGYAVGNGQQTRFWGDVWCGERPLKQDYPDLYNVAADPSSLVAANFSHQGSEIYGPQCYEELYLIG